MTNEAYIEFTFELPEDLQDLAIAMLGDLGFDGYEQRLMELAAYIPERLTIGDSFRGDLEATFRSVGLDIPAFSTKQILPQNWNATFEAGIQPLVAGDFFIRPDWRDDAPPAGKKLLIITPKMAFGTGNHETTKLILQHFSSFVKGGEAVLDVGTGTGILAIAAIKKGAKSAFGFDIDEWSAVNAVENAALNQVEKSVAFVQGSFESVGTDTSYDVVFANLQRHIIIQLADQLAASVKKDGTLVLSGILVYETDEIKQLPAFTGFEESFRDAMGEWSLLVLRKK